MNLIDIAAITTGLTEVLKLTKGLDKLVDGREKLVSLVISLVIALLGGLGVLEGIIAGLISQGLYDSAVQPTSAALKSEFVSTKMSSLSTVVKKILGKA